MGIKATAITLMLYSTKVIIVGSLLSVQHFKFYLGTGTKYVHQVHQWLHSQVKLSDNQSIHVFLYS